jgi:hypothetical protein
MEETALVSSVLGPVECCALAWFARIWASVDIGGPFTRNDDGRVSEAGVGRAAKWVQRMAERVFRGSVISCGTAGGYMDVVSPCGRPLLNTGDDAFSHKVGRRRAIDVPKATGFAD